MSAIQQKNVEKVQLKTGFKVEDQHLNINQVFPRSKKLKNEGVKIDLTLEQEIEYMKCALDPVYFAQNYYKITSIDEGFIFFDPHQYQIDLIRALENHRFVIDMQCRQSGKCVIGETKIKIRKKSTGEVLDLSISEFHEMVKMTDTFKPNVLFRSIWGGLYGRSSQN